MLTILAVLVPSLPGNAAAHFAVHLFLAQPDPLCISHSDQQHSVAPLPLQQDLVHLGRHLHACTGHLAGFCGRGQVLDTF